MRKFRRTKELAFEFCKYKFNRLFLCTTLTRYTRFINSFGHDFGAKSSHAERNHITDKPLNPSVEATKNKRRFSLVNMIFEEKVL